MKHVPVMLRYKKKEPSGSFLLCILLENIVSADIARMFNVGNDFTLFSDLSPFINDLILHMNVFADCGVCKNNTVLYNSALFDLASTSDNRVLHTSFNETAVGDNRVIHVCAVKILSRAGVVCSGIDRPFWIEKVLRVFKINERHVCVKVALEICDGSKESLVGYAADISSPQDAFTI